MIEETFNWRAFLTRWSEEWADTCPDPAQWPLADDGEAWRARWLGFEPASGERIAAAEERLECRLPPSYRAFLEVTDGWRHAGGFVHRLAGADGARWHNDESGFSEYFGEGELDGMWERALQLDVASDATYVLLDPLSVDEDGEWAVYCHKVWAHCEPTRYGSFREFMLASHREFHRLAAHRPERPFANDTTRRLDALVETAALDALRGAYQQAAAALTEAVDFGRPRAAGMLDQLRRLQGETYTVRYGELVQDPCYLREVVPLLAVEQVESRRDATVWGYQVGVDSGERREEADRILHEVTERTFRYSAQGPFGEAVERAREQARWGRTDDAWRTLLAGLPHWTPLGPDHLAPVGLLADSVLGPLITPERGRRMLATPRAAGAAGAPTRTQAGEPAVDPSAGGEDGLAWLAEPSPNNRRPEPYRFVLVEGVAPADLPARLGGEGAVLSAPTTGWETRRDLSRGGVSSSYDDCARAAVGDAGGSGWSFAFDAHPAAYHEPRYVSPAVAASQGPAGSPGARALVVWCAPEQGLFHLSVAEQGTERYAFTVQGSLIHRSGGPIPPALDPHRLFGAPAPDHGHGPDGAGELGARQGERRALAAIAVEFGVSLPRFALTEGRLHTFTTCSWTRPPGPGETYAVISFGAPNPHPGVPGIVTP
ncbi:SMI1/KNR4 family protein [Kitasatospora sp. NPDC087314]|uniref:SMI1/KNR4 family protein n=1 Tax=Kitasatospora sp. NPDC087314 TaxID=3364068 RepID=UPI003822506A